MSARDGIQRLFEAADIKVSAAELDDGVPLRQQGIDSLDFMNLMFQIEQSSGAAISPDESTRLATIDAIARYIDSARAAGAWKE